MLRSLEIWAVQFPVAAAAAVAAAVVIVMKAMGSHLEVEEGCTLQNNDAEGVRSTVTGEDMRGSAKAVQKGLEQGKCCRNRRHIGKEHLPPGRHTWNLLSDRAEHTDSGLR